jgi:hypothetical protein
MRAEGKKIIQVVLAIALVLAAVRVLIIYLGRRAPTSSMQPTATLPADYYVVPKKLHAYDLESARKLTEMPVWVKEGYRYTYYPYQKGRGTDFSHEAGQLGPIERLQITDVVLDRSPGSPDQRQVMAVFEKNGNRFAFPIGAVRGDDYRLYVDEILFIEDPRQLYKHWPADIWTAIEKHEIKPGMNELQASFAVGMGVPEASRSDEKAVRYPNGGTPVKVTYRAGKAVDIKREATPGNASSARQP